MGVIGQLYASLALPPRKELVPTHWIGAGWTPEPVWTFLEKRKILPLSGIEHRIVQSITYLLFRLRCFGWLLICTVSVLFVFRACSYLCGALVKIAECGFAYA